MLPFYLGSRFETLHEKIILTIMFILIEVFILAVSWGIYELIRFILRSHLFKKWWDWLCVKEDANKFLDKI